MNAQNATEWIERIHCASVPADELTDTNCPICQREQRRELIRERGYPLWKCLGCSHMYISPRPSQEWLDSLYGSAYIPDSDNEQVWEQYLDRIFETTARAIRKYHPQTGELLDVGTAFGGFLARAQRDGWRLYGIEPNANAYALAKERLGDRVTLYKSIFETADLEPESFDGIVMMNVIEHMRDPVAICRKAFQLLKPGGFLGLRWPQMSLLNLIPQRVKGIRKTDRAIIGAPIHLHDFTRKSMERLFRAAGYDEVCHAWTSTRRQPGLGWKKSMVAALLRILAYGSHRMTGGRLITPFIARLSLGRKPC